MPGSTQSEEVDIFIEQKDECSELSSSPKLKHLEARGSVSSVDSSISLSYDAAPFTPRGSLTSTNNNTTDDECRISSNENRSSGNDSSDAVSENECTTFRNNVGNDVNNNNTAAAAAGSDNSDGGGHVGEMVNQEDEEETDYERPDEELTKRIVNQVEYYFSDDNIVKDAFLLKHVRRNKEGYVSLKLIASFKRVKHIAKDWRVVRDSLKKSTKLAINEAGTKLRRLDPLPLYDQTTPSRTVVAINIPPEKATIESIAEMFRLCGEIALVRILRPGNPIPADVRPFYNKHPEMQGAVSALIEFVRTESAHNALNKDTDKKMVDNSEIQVLELNAPATKKRVVNGKQKFPMNRMFDSEFSSSCQSGSEPEDVRYKFRVPRRGSSPHLTINTRITEQTPMWNQRRWSRDSGSDSPGSNFSRSRSNSGVGIYMPPEQVRRMSAGWESSSDSYGSCRSRSSSGVSIPDIFSMRRYSQSRKEPTTPECCCCGHAKCESSVLHNHNNMNNPRRYSIGRNSDLVSDGYANPRQPLSRCNSDCGGAGDVCRRESVPEFYSIQRRNSAVNNNFERRPSFGKPLEPSNGNGNSGWSRSNSGSSIECNGRRLSDSEGRIAIIRQQRSFGSTPPNIGPGSENIIRLPRGPDGGRGFQRDLMEYPLPE